MKDLISACVVVVAAGAWATVDIRTCGVKGDGLTDDAAAIQKVIDEHPNQTLYFPDGTYLLSRPIATPAHPKRAVDLQLANFAVLKAAPGWTNQEAMVRLGGIHPANDIRTPGSVYSLTGGIIDGSGVAKGVSIDSGRETRVERVSMKNVQMGLHIKKGANSGSSDCDILNVHIVGNGARDSVGVWVEGHDNHLTSMRIANVYVGVKLTGGGNLLRNIHPLFTGRWDWFEESVGFIDRAADNYYSTCYSDQFSTAFDLGPAATVLEGCIAWWYSRDPGRRHTAIRCPKQFNALATNFRIGYRGAEAKNTVLEVGAEGGTGFLRDLRMDESRVNETARTYLKYKQGICH